MEAEDGNGKVLGSAGWRPPSLWRRQGAEKQPTMSPMKLEIWASPILSRPFPVVMG